MGHKSELSRSAAYPPLLGLAIASCAEWLEFNQDKMSRSCFLDSLASLILSKLPLKGVEPWSDTGSDQ